MMFAPFLINIQQQNMKMQIQMHSSEEEEIEQIKNGQHTMEKNTEYLQAWSQYRQCAIHQYYQFLKLLKYTSCFTMTMAIYKHLEFQQYQRLAICGSFQDISQIDLASIENRKSEDEGLAIHKFVGDATNLIFSEKGRQQYRKVRRQDRLPRITHKIIISKELHAKTAYKYKCHQHLMEYLQDKNLCITNLQIIFSSSRQLYFRMTNESTVMELTMPFYKQIFRPFQRAMAASFSHVDLFELAEEERLVKEKEKAKKDTKEIDDSKDSTQKDSARKINNVDLKIGKINNVNLKIGNGKAITQGEEVQTQQLVNLNELKHKIKNYYKSQSMVGRVSCIWKSNQYRNWHLNKQEREVHLTVIDDSLPFTFSEIGQCQIEIRVRAEELVGFEALVRKGSVYLFNTDEVTMKDDGQLMFKINNWQEINLVNHPHQDIQLYFDHLCQKMTIRKIKSFTQNAVFRNYYKLRVVKYQTKLFWVKAQCQACRKGLTGGYQNTHCSYQCQFFQQKMSKRKIKLNVFAKLIVKDSSSTMQLVVHDDIALSFFELEDVKEELMKEVVQENKDGSGLKIYYHNNEDGSYMFSKSLFSSSKSSFGKVYAHCTFLHLEKIVLGSLKLDWTQNTNEVSGETIQYQQQQLQMNSLISQKEAIKKIKININGYYMEKDNHYKIRNVMKVEKVFQPNYYPTEQDDISDSD